MLKKKNNLFTLTFFILNFYFFFYQIAMPKEINFSHYILIDSVHSFKLKVKCCGVTIVYRVTLVLRTVHLHDF